MSAPSHTNTSLTTLRDDKGEDVEIINRNSTKNNNTNQITNQLTSRKQHCAEKSSRIITDNIEPNTCNDTHTEIVETVVDQQYKKEITLKQMKEIYHANRKRRYIDAFVFVMGSIKFCHNWIVDEVIVDQMNVWFCNKNEDPFVTSELLPAIKSAPQYANIGNELYNNSGLFHRTIKTRNPNIPTMNRKKRNFFYATHENDCPCKSKTIDDRSFKSRSWKLKELSKLRNFPILTKKYKLPQRAEMLKKYAELVQKHGRAKKKFNRIHIGTGKRAHSLAQKEMKLLMKPSAKWKNY